MPSEVGEQVRRPPVKGQSPVGAAAAAEQEHLPCPRCDSTNTKFCYYNNYNFSQPRHFCKSCRRYWTHGGTLRDIPVGGGSRKNAKRSRTTTSGGGGGGHHLPATPLFLPLSATSAAVSGAAHGGGAVSFGGAGEVKAGGGLCGGSFTSLLSTQGPGFLALGGFGIGLGNGLEDFGFGLGRGIWPFAGVGDGGGGGGGGGGASIGGNGGGARGMGAAWQFDGGDHHHHGHVGGLVAAGAAGDFCSWAEPAISTPGSGLK